MLYLGLKHLHVLAVYLSLALFLLRGVWMWRESPRLQARWLRIVPHLIDTILLGAAIALLVMVWGNPLNQPWLIAKIIALLAYIGLGSLALKRGKTPALRRKAFIAALGVYAYMLAVAVSKSAIPGV